MISSKKQLLREMSEHNGDLLLSYAEMIIGRDQPAPERIHGILHGLVEYHSELVLYPARAGRKAELRRACRNLLRGVVTNGLVDGRLDCDDPEETVDVLLDATEHFHTWGVSAVTGHMIQSGVDPNAHLADSWPAIRENEIAFNRRWIVLRQALGIRNATLSETRVMRDHARKLIELRNPVTA